MMAHLWDFMFGFEASGLQPEEVSVSITVKPKGYAAQKADRALRRRQARRQLMIQQANRRVDAIARELALPRQVVALAASIDRPINQYLPDSRVTQIAQQVLASGSQTHRALTASFNLGAAGVASGVLSSSHE